MTARRLAVLLAAAAVLAGCSRSRCPVPCPTAPAPAPAPAAAGPALPSPAVPHDPFPGEEKHLRNIRQLTFGGENAEAYWSFDGERVVFQATRPPYVADQIFTMRPDGSDVRLVSTGMGRTTCAFFLPGDRRLLYASTHAQGYEPPKPPDRAAGYVWGLFEYDIYACDLTGQELRPLVAGPGYDAEATVSPTGDRIVFTSSRDGDVEIYTCAVDGSDVRRITDAVGYDGGAVFSPDGKKLAWRAQRPADDAGKEAFRALLAKGMVRPSQLELWVADVDGKNARQITSNGKANFGPFFTHDGQHLIFSSNLGDPKGRSFDLWMIGIDGEGLERVTNFSNDAHDDFDGFPMFSPDGKHLLWCSNRHNGRPHETNVFVADWIP